LRKEKENFPSFYKVALSLWEKSFSRVVAKSIRQLPFLCVGFEKIIDYFDHLKEFFEKTCLNIK